MSFFVLLLYPTEIFMLNTVDVVETFLKIGFLVKFSKTFLDYVFTFLLFTVLSGRKLWVVLPKDIEINPLSCDPSCSYQQVCTSLMFLPTGMYVLHVPINRYVRPSCSYQQVCTSFMFLPTGMYVLHVPTKRYVRPSCSYQQVCASLMFLPTGIYVLHLPIKRYVRYPASIPFLREQTCKGTYVVISINPPYLIHNCTIETLI